MKLTKITSAIALVVAATYLQAQQVGDDFGVDIDREFERQEQRIDDIYNAVDKAIAKAMDGTTKRIVVHWPDGALPQRTRWVTYDKEMTTRVIVDYTAGEVIAESLISNEQPPEAAMVKARTLLQQLLAASPEHLNEQDTLLQAIDAELRDIVTPSLVAKAPEPTSASNTAAPDAEPTKKDDQETLAEEAPLAAIIAPQSEQQTVVPAQAEQAADVARLTFKFVNGYQEKLIQQHLPRIQGLSAEYEVPVSVILAIIETESSFNPRAVSPIPAFGLMQLVPKTAGVDAYKFVYGEEKVVTAEFLFDEQNNLALGSAYFHLLNQRYLRKIKDPMSRFYCAVASYNTGVGNLARTFTGAKNINKAVDKINAMESEQVYEFLLQQLPAEETRNYLRKIVDRMRKYQTFDQPLTA